MGDLDASSIYIQIHICKSMCIYVDIYIGVTEELGDPIRPGKEGWGGPFHHHSSFIVASRQGRAGDGP